MFKHKITNLKHEDISEVELLWELAKKQDGFASKHYQQVMAGDYRNHENDFCVWHGKKLIAYMGFFLFVKDEAEVVAFVHPNYRNKGLFNQLFKRVKKRIQAFDCLFATFGINHESKSAYNAMQAIKAEKDHTEYRMERNTNTEVFNNTMRIGFKEVGLSQLQFLTLIHSQSFPTPREVVEQRFRATMDEGDRKTWMILHQNKGIGKIHIRVEEDGSAFIHDVCVVPKMQGRGIGKLAMQGAMNMIIQEKNVKKLALEVEGHNERALRLYKSLGFEVVEGFDFFKVRI